MLDPTRNFLCEATGERCVEGGCIRGRRCIEAEPVPHIVPSPIKKYEKGYPAARWGSGGTWRDDVRTALERLGGRARLYRIYQEVRAVRTAAGRAIPTSLDATTRHTLEVHSSDSENYRGGPDLFCILEGKGAGVWGLRSGMHKRHDK